MDYQIAYTGPIEVYDGKFNFPLTEHITGKFRVVAKFIPKKNVQIDSTIIILTDYFTLAVIENYEDTLKLYQSFVWVNLKDKYLTLVFENYVDVIDTLILQFTNYQEAQIQRDISIKWQDTPGILYSGSIVSRLSLCYRLMPLTRLYQLQ